LLFTPSPLIKIKRFSLIWFVLVVSFAFGILLTFGRGGWIILIIGIMIWIILLNRVFVLFAIPLIFLLLLSPFISEAFFGHLPSALKGMQEAIEQPIGRGLGTAGQLALYHSENAVEESGESYLAALAFQTGILGVLTYSYFVFSLSKQLWNICQRSRRITNSKHFFPYARLALMLIVGIFATSLFANSAVAPISSGASLMYCGMTITAWHQWLRQQNSEIEVTENVGTG
jgi:O-antigen ligase